MYHIIEAVVREIEQMTSPLKDFSTQLKSEHKPEIKICHQAKLSNHNYTRALLLTSLKIARESTIAHLLTMSLSIVVAYTIAIKYLKRDRAVLLFSITNYIQLFFKI